MKATTSALALLIVLLAIPFLFKSICMPFSSCNQPAFSTIEYKGNINIIQNPNDIVGVGLKPPQQASVHPRCLGVGRNEDLHKLILKSRVVYIVTPSRCAGQAFKTFTEDCMSRLGIQAYRTNLLPMNREELRSEFLQSQFEIPHLVHAGSSTNSSKGTLIDLARQITRNSLIIYNYREETDRVASALRNFVEERVLKKENSTDSDSNSTEADKEDVLYIREIGILNELEKVENKSKLKSGNTRLLTCDTYTAIKDNLPNLVFVNYQQTNAVMELLEDHFCPRHEEKDISNTNNSTSMSFITPRTQGGPQIMVKRGAKESIPLEEWINGKMNFLEITFDMNRKVSCQGKTRKMERKLFSCPDHALHFSSTEGDPIPADF